MKKIYVRFHIGRGGSFHNQGHLSFVNEDNFQDLIRACGDKLLDKTSEYDEATDTEKEIPEDEWNYHDCGGKILVEGREAMEADTGILDWDGLYDTDIVTTTDDLSDAELECLWEAYTKDTAFMSDELQDEICTLKDKKRVHKIFLGPSSLIIYTQDEAVELNFDGMIGEFTRDEWKEELEEQDFCPLSIEKILDELESCYTNEKDFFKDE